MRIAFPSSGCVLLTILAAPASAQLVGGEWSPVFQISGDTQSGSLGYSMAGVGDIDGDGHDDVLVGGPHATSSGGFNAGTALLLSGRDGTTIRRFDGSPDYAAFGRSMDVAGDVDADGTPDFVIGGGWNSAGLDAGAGYVWVFSGRTNALLYSFVGASPGDHFGYSVAGVGDVNTDGHDDILVGAPQPHSIWMSAAPGYAILFSGRDGSVLRTYFGTAGSQDQLGWAVSSAGDMDTDGVPDFLVGAPEARPGGVVRPGSVYLYSGASGVEILRVDGPRINTYLGMSLTGLPDVSGDGIPDFAAGAPWGAELNGVRSGLVFVYSGATGGELFHLEGWDGSDALGFALASVGDIDEDGNGDLLIGARYGGTGTSNGPGYAVLVSGTDGRLIQSFVEDTIRADFGHSVAGVGDASGDGSLEVGFGAPGWRPGGVGSARGAISVRDFNPILRSNGGTLSASSGQAVALTLDFPQSEAGQRYAVLASEGGTGPFEVGGVKIPLTLDPLLGALVRGWSPPNASGLRGTLDMNGDGAASLESVAALASFVGRSGHVAVVSYDLAGQRVGLSSIARPLTIVP